MSNFIRALKQGKKYERKAVSLFDYDTVKMTEGYCKEYDFSYTKDNITKYVEVKSDKIASRTDNLCIEFKYRGKPSGIDATTADYWVYYILYPKDNDLSKKIIKEEVFKIPTDDLRKLVKNCREVKGGDHFRSDLYLLHRNWVSQYLVDK